MANTKSVLIVGGSGLIGTHLALKLRDRHKVYATYASNPIFIPGVTSLPMGLGNRNWTKRLVYMTKPDAVIYAAGINSVEWTNRAGREGELVHTSGPASVAAVADILQPRFVYLSNCYTFDGLRGNYHETDVVLPSTNLGKLKLGGENFIRGKSLNYNIIRLSPVLGRGNGLRMGLFDRIRLGLSRGERVELNHSEYHSWISIDSAVEMITRVIEGGPKNRILHAGGLTKLTAFEVGQLLAKRWGYDPAMITPSAEIATGHTATVAMKAQSGSLDYSLNSSQAVETLKIKPLFIEESFDLIEQGLVARS